MPTTTLQRKKSLPDFQELPRATGAMSREEVSYLGSARREEMRRQADEKERLRANPLLYLVSPQVKVNQPLLSFLYTSDLILIRSSEPHKRETNSLLVAVFASHCVSFRLYLGLTQCS